MKIAAVVLCMTIPPFTARENGLLDGHKKCDPVVLGHTGIHYRPISGQTRERDRETALDLSPNPGTNSESEQASRRD